MEKVAFGPVWDSPLPWERQTGIVTGGDEGQEEESSFRKQRERRWATRQCRVSALGTQCDTPKHRTDENGGEVWDPEWKMTLKKQVRLSGRALNATQRLFNLWCRSVLPLLFHPKLPLVEEDNKISVLGGGGEGWTGRARPVFRAVKPSCVTLWWWILDIMHLSTP